jgi:hypothetical protein
VVVDTWLASDPATGRKFAGVRRVIPVSLRAGERADHVLRIEGVPFLDPATMVRCMPGYVTAGYPLEEG